MKKNKFTSCNTKERGYVKRMVSKVGVSILALTLIGSLVACGIKVEENNNLSPTTIASPTEDVMGNVTLPTKDPAGNSIEIPTEVNRIISLAPSITQVMEKLGVANKLVAVDTQSRFSSTIDANLPQLDLTAPDLEQILELAPELVYVSSMTNYNGEDILKVVREAGITVVEIPTSDSLEEVKTDILFIADTLRMRTEGDKLVEELEDAMKEIAAIGATIEDKKTVYFEIAAAPYMYSFGDNVFLNEMIELIGAKNMLSGNDGWMSISGESIIAGNPDVILTNINYIEAPTEEIKNRDGYGELKAIKNNDVYYIDNVASSLPNHNVILALKQMAKAVYPEQYKEIK